MSDILYFISEVSRMVGVEAHVLRYWEEELELNIQRNSQGKRCYTEENVEQLKRIKYWKDKGMQLKAVKEMMEGELWENQPVAEGETIHESQPVEEGEVIHESQPVEEGEAFHESQPVTERADHASSSGCEFDQMFSCELVTIEEPSDSMKKFEQLLDAMIGRALERNNEKLVQEICDAILQELDEKLEARMEELLQQELLQEMVREGEREAAASVQKEREGIWKRWKRRLEQWF